MRQLVWKSWRGHCPGIRNPFFRFPSMARWTLLAVVPTSTDAFHVITLLICDEVIRLRFLGLVIHFADLLWLFEVAALAHWISLTAYIASKQFTGLCSSVGVIAKCFATNWDLINFALLAFCFTCANQGHYIKYENCQRHLAYSRPSERKKKTKTKIRSNKNKNFKNLKRTDSITW